MLARNWKPAVLFLLLLANAACALLWSGSRAEAESALGQKEPAAGGAPDEPAAVHDKFISRDLGVSCAIPKLGLPTAGEAIRPAFSYSGKPRNGFSPNINLLVEHRSVTRAAYDAEQKKSFALSGWVLISSESVTCSGRDALRYEFTGSFAGRALHWMSLAIIEPERVLLLTCTAGQDNFADVKAEFMACLESFALLEPAKESDPVPQNDDPDKNEREQK